MSLTLTPRPSLTPDDLESLPNSVIYELVEGRLVERHMGMESSEIAARIIILIGLYLRQNRLGRVFGSDAGYVCFPDDVDKLRKPDVSVIRMGRLPGDHPPRGYASIPPDLAVEVISPGDLADEVEKKVAEYLGAGVPLVWVVHPPTRTVRVHRPRTAASGSVSDLTDADALDGEQVLPGFSCQVRELFD